MGKPQRKAKQRLNRRVEAELKILQQLTPLRKEGRTTPGSMSAKK